MYSPGLGTPRFAFVSRLDTPRTAFVFPTRPEAANRREPADDVRE